ncbi:MAG: serine/threonine protein kinase [Leptothrix sp. (in: b-proteobacteria)]
MPDNVSLVAPYATLGPDTVLDALYLAGLEPDGRLLQLNSYENRVYQANLEGGRVVVAKFYRPARWSDAQILEEHSFSAELAANDLPVVSPFGLAQAVLDNATGGNTLGHFASASGERFRFAVCERRVGRAPELEQPETQAWLGRLIGRMHAVGARDRFAHRRRLDVETFGHAPRRRLIDGGFVRPESEGAWLNASAQALDEIAAAFARHDGLRTLRLHGDCHPGNVLWREEGAFAGPNFVDFDDCCTGPAIQDLWMLLPGERGAVDASLHHLLDGYRDFMDFDDRELLLIEPLRTLRMLHHSAWLAERWSDPAFPVAFPWFGSPNYWQQQTTELREQIERMQDI